MNDKILDRVRKLLALANDAAASEGERENAIRMAHGMLLKHNLSMLDLDKHLQVEGRIELPLETFGMNWARCLAGSVAKLFFCSVYVAAKVNGTKMRYMFIGRESNVVTASLMTEYLINSILKECRKQYGHNLAAGSRAFATGAMHSLHVRIEALMKPEDQEPGTGLVVVNLRRTEAEANEEFLKAKGTSLKPYGKKTQAVNTEQYSAGRQYGNGLSLNDQVSHKKNSSKQLQ